MIKSFTNKIKTFVFSDSSRDNHVTQSRKRKRDSDERFVFYFEFPRCDFQISYELSGFTLLRKL